MIYRMAAPFSRGIRSGFSHIEIVTLCILTHIYVPKTQSVTLFLPLFFRVKAASIDNAAMPNILLSAVRFGQQRERVYFRNLTKNADNSGVFGLCTPLTIGLHPPCTPSEQKSQIVSASMPLCITEPTVDTIISCRFVIFMRENAVISRFFCLQMHPLRKRQSKKAKILLSLDFRLFKLYRLALQRTHYR